LIEALVVVDGKWLVRARCWCRVLPACRSLKPGLPDSYESEAVVAEVDAPESVRR
jgi:hypothetical protein